MATRETNKESPVWLTGEYKTSELTLKRAIVREKFSCLTDMTVEFTTKKKSGVDLADIVGYSMGVVVETATEKKRQFSGVCVSVENLGFHDGFGQYVAEVRPWLWMLTRASNNRIFQDKDAVEIIEEVFGDHGFTHFEKKLTDSYEKREYCVQYRETDYDFVHRLMVEEGIYYYFDNGTANDPLEKLVLCDGVSAHKPMPENAELEFFARHGKGNKRQDYVGEWSSAETLRTGKYSLTDYDFTSPSADLTVVNAIKKGKHSYGTYEKYHYPGHYRKETARGNRLVRVMMEAEAIQHKFWRGSTLIRNLSTGYSFKLKDHPDVKSSDEFIVTGTTHYIQHSANFDDTERRRDLKSQMQDFPEEMKENYSSVFWAIPKKEQFRAPFDIKWPEIPGLHTATVVGKSGEEIWTDEYGRIKVQFPWDRVGEKNENSSCWVRVVTPWSGKGWGFVAVPRMGQEVVIQFEEGDPDRPICTGMMYNAETKPAYSFPDNATQLGIRSNSSKGGAADTNYNELMFEDKSGEEFYRMQAEKDHQFLVKNKSVVTIGQPEIDAGAHDDEGSLSEVIRNNVTRTIQEGSHYYTIEKGDEEFKINTGSQTIDIKTDKTQTVEGKFTETITGNYGTTVKQGNQTTEISMGNQTNTVKMGNITCKASLGKIEMEAMQSIELKVGQSSIKLDQTGVTIKGMMITVDGKIKTDVKGLITTVTGNAMLTLKGGITMIN